MIARKATYARIAPSPPDVERRSRILNHLYEGMFLLDNDVVRAGWNDAKTALQGALEKHGAKLRTLRRWDERALAYPIRGKRRGTFLLSYFELPADGMTMLTRDLEIREDLLRYLMLRVDEVPEGEDEAATAELADDFEAPEPPADDVGTYSPLQDGDPEAEDEEGEEDAVEGEEKAEAMDDAPAAEADLTETTDAN